MTTNQSKTFRIFVSSTFSDLRAERNALQERVFTRLRKLCTQHGARFQAIDLRWGVSEEAALDQQTMNICLAEIDRCQQVSPRPNFVLLLGDRYGWMPPPPQIPAEEFTAILGKIDNMEDRTLLRKWYWRDDNAVPPEYCLQPREGEMALYEHWEPVERRLQQVLENAALKLDLWPDELIKYTASATEQEIVDGAMRVADARDHVFCFFREIEGLPEDIRAKGLVDLDAEGRWDSEAKNKLQDLKSRLAEYMPENIHPYPARWQEDGITLDHLEQLCNDVYKRLSRMILDELSLIDEVDPLEVEFQAHATFGEERARFFAGRAGYLRRIGEYLEGTSTQPMAIWGESGSGKSALLAKAVQEAQDAYGDEGVIYRFIGATPDSTSGRTLLESLCRQISRRYNASEDDMPIEYRELAEEFPKHLELATAEQPLFLFLDALDQLSDVDNARNLAWLPAKLPQNVRLVVSTLPNECRDALEARYQAEQLVELQPMPVDEAEELLGLWLEDARRTLQPEQREDVRTRFAGCPKPLFLKLAFEEARRWHSYDSLPKGADEVPGLSEDIPGIIQDLFARLAAEANHGEMLVSRSLGYLAAAKNGLSEDELLDVLSLDEEVMADFVRRSPKSPEVGHLPVVVWSRLYADLEPYLAQRAADGTSLMTFYHPTTFGNAVRETYLGEKVKTDRHRSLAGYFGDQALELEKDDEVIPNLRKLSELPYQQGWGHMWGAVTSTLTDFDFLLAKVSAVGPQHLIEDYDEVTNAGYEDRDLSLVQDALRLSSHVLMQNASQLAGQFIGRLCQCSSSSVQTMVQQASGQMKGVWLKPLTNSLTPPSGPLYRTLAGHSGMVEAVIVLENGKYAISASRDKTMRVWDLETGAVVRVFEGFESYIEAIHLLPDGKTVLCALSEHTIKCLNLETGKIFPLTGKTPYAWINDLSVSQDGERALISGSKDYIQLLEVENGRVLRTFYGHRDNVSAIAFSPDGKIAISGSEDKSIKLWDLEAPEELMSIDAHTEWISSLAVFDKGRTAITASGDATLKVWGLETGMQLNTLRGHTGPIDAIEIYPDGKSVLSISRDSKIKTWHAESGELIRTLPGPTERMSCVVILQNGKVGLIGTFENKIYLINLLTGEVIRVLNGHSSAVRSVALFSDNRRAISASDDKTLRVWDIYTGEILTVLEGHAHEVTGVLILPDESRVVSKSSEIKVWDLEAAQVIRTLDGVAYNRNAFALCPDGKHILAAAFMDGLGLWNLESGEMVHNFLGHHDSPGAVAIFDAGRKAISGEGGNLKIWDLEARTIRRTIHAHEEAVTDVIFHPDLHRSISASKDGTIRVCDLHTPDPDLATLSGHTSAVVALALTRDQSIAASGSATGDVRIWDLTKRVLLQRLEIHSEMITSLSFFPDARHILTTSTDSTLQIWDRETERAVHFFTGHNGGIYTAKLFPDGKRIISASFDQTLKLWNLETGDETCTLDGHTDHVTDVQILPDGDRVVSTSIDTTLRIWDVTSGEVISVLRGHTGPVRKVELLPGGRYAISASFDTTLIVWDLATGERIHTLRGHSEAIDAIAIFSSGKRAISTSRDHSLIIWDLIDGKGLNRLVGHSGAVSDIKIYSHENRAISASIDNTLKIWDLDSGEFIKTLGEPIRTAADPDRPVYAVEVFGGERYAVSGSGDSTLKIWDIQSKEVLQTLRDAGYRLAVTDDGKRLVSGSREGKFNLWDIEPGEKLQSVQGHAERISDISIFNRNQFAITASWDKLVKIWNLHAFERYQTIDAHSKAVAAISIIDDRRAISVSQDSTYRIWDVSNGEQLKEEKINIQLVDVAVFPDGELALTASNDLVIWNIDDGSISRRLPGHEYHANAVDILKNGTRAISSCETDAHEIKIWDLESPNSLIMTLEGHQGDVEAVEVFDNGKRAISASADKTLRIWDLENGETVKILSGHWDTISAVRVFDAGKRAVSSSWDGTLKIWDLETGLNPLTINCHQGYLFGVTVFDKGRKAVSVGRNRTLKVWNLVTGEAIRTLEGHKNEVWYASVYDNGQRAVSSGKDSDLRFWNLETGELVQEQKGGIVTTDNNEKYVISATSDLITVWDSDDGKKIKEIAGHSVGGLLGITICDDDQRIYICGSRGRMDMIDLNSGEVLRSLQCHHAPVKAIAVFDDGWKAITASDDQTLRIWDLQAKEEISTIRGLRFAVFPDMRRVLVARTDRSYFIYDSETGNITEHVKHLPGTAETLAVFPDSKHAVAALKDGSMWILDLEDKNRTINCFLHKGVKDVAVDPGGRYFVSVSEDRTLKLWEMKRLGDFISTAEYIGDSPFTSCVINPKGTYILAGDNSGRIHFLHIEGINNIDDLESL